MAYINGDRVCVRNELTSKLEFGRIQEYVDVEEPSCFSGQFSNYGDVLSSDDTLFSSTSGSSLESVKRRVPLLHLMTPSNKVKKRSSSLSSCYNKNEDRDAGLVMPGMTSPVMMMRSKSQPTLRQSDGEKEDKDGSSSIKKQIVWDDSSKGVTGIIGGKSERMFRVIDRKFSVGQSVIKNGRRGKVVAVLPHATLQLFNGFANESEPLLITDIPVSEIQPISSIFCGVTVEFNGWIGQVIEVQRRATYKLEDSRTITRTFYDTILTRNSRFTPIIHTKSSPSKRQRLIHQQFPYPFMPQSEMPFPGKLEKFSNMRLEQLKQEEEEDKENVKRYSTRSNKTGDSTRSNKTGDSTAEALALVEGRKRNKLDCINAFVESVRTVCVKVRWIGRLPGYLIKPVEKGANGMPTTFIRLEEDIKQLCPLYINPAMYFDKNGLCVCANESQTMVPETTWSKELYEGRHDYSTPELVAPFNLRASRKDSRGENATDDWIKKTRCQDEENPNKQRIIVCKHFVRHKYRVVWDETVRNAENSLGASGVYWGTDLLAHQNQEHSICLGLIHSHLYVVPKTGSLMDGKCDYGIVLQKPDDNHVVVEWLKILEHGNVETVRILKCKLFDIDKHPDFNQLHEGKIVVKKSCVDSQFRFGTIVMVKRFELGQICVYCAVNKKMMDVWPHMLELFSGMSMPELISLNLVGVNKKSIR